MWKLDLHIDDQLSHIACGDGAYTAEPVGTRHHCCSILQKFGLQPAHALEWGTPATWQSRVWYGPGTAVVVRFEVGA